MKSRALTKENVLQIKYKLLSPSSCVRTNHRSVRSSFRAWSLNQKMSSKRNRKCSLNKRKRGWEKLWVLCFWMGAHFPSFSEPQYYVRPENFIRIFLGIITKITRILSLADRFLLYSIASVVKLNINLNKRLFSRIMYYFHWYVE